MVAGSVGHGGTVGVPVPGMKRRGHLDENVAAIEVELSPEELARLPVGAAAGDRYTPEGARWAGR